MSEKKVQVPVCNRHSTKMKLARLVDMGTIKLLVTRELVGLVADNNR